MAANQDYDFIIVGSGPAGSTLAARLSSTSTRPSVLLLEAGGENANLSFRVDCNKYIQHLEPEQAWGYVSEPIPAMDNRTMPLARGKGLGGTSGVNFGGWVEGPREDVDYMAEYTGDDSWQYEKVKKRWISLQNYKCEDADLPINVANVRKYINPSPGSYGTEGPIFMGHSYKFDHEVTDLADVWEQSGYRINPDPNSGDCMGFGMCPMTSYHGTRSTAADQLHSAPDNLSIVTGAQVHRVLFDDADDKKLATGVITIDGRTFRAKKEVILCAGSLDTPKIMMLSGIGPADQLTKFNIPIVHENPEVGGNVKDHYFITLQYQRDEKTSVRPGFHYASKEQHKAWMREWELYRSGPYAWVGSAINLGWFKCDGVRNSAEFAALPAAEQQRLDRPGMPMYEVIFNVTSTSYYTAPDTPAVVTVLINLLHTQTNGRCELQSADPSQPLKFHVDFLNHPYDRRVAIETTRETMKVIAGPAFQKDNVADFSVPKSDSDEDILQFWRDDTRCTWHMSCSCRMGRTEKGDGKDGQGGAVVDTNFKVFGVKKLRIADMSVMPFLVSTHTQPYAYQVGMTLAEKLTKEYAL